MDCSDCGNHLDVPIYCDEDKATHGYNYCPICAARLFGQGVDYKRELKRAKRLLKTAVEGFDSLGKNLNKSRACSFVGCFECPMGGISCNQWKYKAEAIDLLGEEDEQC